MWNELLLCATAVLAGMVNSVAGGGTLLTFPSLLAVLAVSPSAAVIANGVGVMANGTSTVALWPASVISAWEFRREFRQAGRWLVWLLVPSVIGGLTGTLLVTELPPGVFDSLVPWLILIAALLFALQPQINRWIKIGAAHERPAWPKFAGILLFQLLVALYGGYFGAGIGILMLSSLALMGIGDINSMNAVKTVLTACINGTSVVVFMLDQKIEWSYALPMAVCAIVGGYFGARAALKVHPRRVRWAVIAIGFGLAAYFFYRQHAGA